MGTPNCCTWDFASYWGRQNAALMIQAGPALTQDPWWALATGITQAECNNRIRKAKTAEWKKPQTCAWEELVKCRQGFGIQNHMHCVNWNRTMLISILGWYSPWIVGVLHANKTGVTDKIGFCNKFLVVLFTSLDSWPLKKRLDVPCLSLYS